MENLFTNGLALVAGVLAFALFLALVNERLVERFIAPVLEGIGLKYANRYASLLTGAAISLGFGIDLLSPLAVAVGLDPLVPWLGALLTGLMVGSGSQWLHDIWPGKAS